jgi:hypothetical protein
MGRKKDLVVNHANHLHHNQQAIMLHMSILQHDSWFFNENEMNKTIDCSKKYI